MTATAHDWDEEKAARICLDLQERFDWDLRSTAYQVARSWTSRTADFFLCQGAGTSESVVVLKVLARERNPQPQADYVTLKQLEEVHRQAPVVTARPPRALGWMVEPAALAMEYLPGESGSNLVVRYLSARAIGELERLVRVSGATLGAWHARWEVKYVNDTRHEAYRRLSRAARRLGIRLSTVLQGASGLSLVRRFRDFSVHNTQRLPDGQIAILDPPAASGGHDLACRDMAWFLASIASAAIGEAGAKAEVRRRVSEYAGTRENLVRCFMAGYAETADVNAPGAEIRAAALLEAAFLLARSRRYLGDNHVRALNLARLGLHARMLAVGGGNNVTQPRDKQ